MFWEGFNKRASLRIGVKAVQPLSAAGKMVGNKPSTLVSTVAKHTPARLPTVSPHSAKHISKAKLPNSVNIG